MKQLITWREVGNLVTSILVLGFLFSLNDLNNFIPFTLIVGLAFAVHELTHKFVAERYGCKAEYVLWPQGILFSVLLAVITRGSLIFAAIGYVSISTYYATRLGFKFTYLTMEENGKISAAGPVSNIVLGIISGLIAPYAPIMYYSASLNFMLAIFNLMPFPPLDGSKVFVWSRMTWIALIISAGVTWALTFMINPIIAGIIGVIVMIVVLFYTFFKGF